MSFFQSAFAFFSQTNSFKFASGEGANHVSELDERRHFMTVAEVAQLMRVSTMTVYRLIKAGELSAIRVGRSYRIRPDDVDQYLGDRYTEAG
ncbi:MAG: excisionase family DNA binding protein [Verrucomicrobiales bacterium]